MDIAVEGGNYGALLIIKSQNNISVIEKRIIFNRNDIQDFEKAVKEFKKYLEDKNKVYHDKK